MPAKDFDKFLTMIIDESLYSFGENLKLSVYSRLEEAFGVSKSEIANKAALLSRVLDEILGADAGNVEALILRRLYENLGKSVEQRPHAGLSFVEQVKLARCQLYSDFVSKMQSAVAVFYLENPADPECFRLIAFNSAAVKLTGVAAESVIGKTMTELYPEMLNIEVQKMLFEVLRHGKPKELGEFHVSNSSETLLFSVAAFLLSTNCVGLVFRNVKDRVPPAVRLPEVQMQGDSIENGMGGWRWEPEVVDKQAHADRLRAREQWARQRLSSESRTAEFFSIRGGQYLKDGEFSRARDFFLKAEEMLQKRGRTEEAFRNASLRLDAFLLEEKVRVPEFFDAAESYFKRYAQFFTHEDFVRNLAYYHQWKGYVCGQNRNFSDSRKFHSEAEKLFVTVKRTDDALYNASRSVLTYRSEGRPEDFAESASGFLSKYSGFSENKYYREILAHHLSREAEKTKDVAKARELWRQAEKLFLEIDQRRLAFENACRFVELCWTGRVAEDNGVVEKCLEETEIFLDRYKDFSEEDFYRKTLAEYYLRQARVFASQLKNALR